MKKFIWYSDKIATAENFKLPGVEKFCYHFKIFPFGYSIIFDRSHTIRLPIQTLDLDPMPEYRGTDKSFEEISYERGQEILKMSDELNCEIHVMYSGGIDSTLVLLSIIKFATDKQKEKIVVFMTENSITENQSFYDNHIKGKLRIRPTSLYMELIGSKNLLVTGENNDQLFGGNILIGYKKKYGVKKLHEKFSKEDLANFFEDANKDKEMNMFFAEFIEKLGNNAKVKLTTNHDYLWWFIFTCRWQTAGLKPFSYVQKENYDQIDETYIKKYYISFFASPDFQQWSMANLDKKMGDTWESYKQVCKDIIYKFNPDENYWKNKIKFGSFWRVSKGNRGIDFMDDSYNISDEVDFKNFYNPDNDFI